MRQVVSPKLKAATKGDPWAEGMDLRQLDVSSCTDTELRPITLDEDDFQVREDPKALSNAQVQKIALKDRSLIEEAIKDLGKSNRWTKAEEQRVFEAFDPQRERVFHVGGYTCKGEHLKTGWLVTATHDETGERIATKLPQIASDDVTGMMAAASRYLNRRDFQKKPYRDLTEAELDQVARVAAGGNIGSMMAAGELYLGFALSQYSDDDDPLILERFKNDVRFIPLWHQAAWYCFLAGRPDVDAEGEQWMREKLDGKVVTIPALWTVYEMWQEERKRPRHLFGEVQPEPEPAPTRESLEDATEGMSQDQLGKFIAKARKLVAYPAGPSERE